MMSKTGYGFVRDASYVVGSVILYVTGEGRFDREAFALCSLFASAPRSEPPYETPRMSRRKYSKSRCLRE
jgi:hypothetical protein